jgi:hypothetical protein
LGAGAAATEGEAAATVGRTLSDANISPAELPSDLYSKMLTDAQAGQIRPAVIKAQAEAATVGTRLSEGQATGDAAQYSQEVNLAKLPGGEPYAQLFKNQNQDMMNYLDNTLGARTAASPAEAGQTGLTRLAQIDQQLDQAKNAAYNVVRDSQGRSATLDAERFYMNAQGALERDNVAQFVPPKIGAMYDDITEGRLPLTIDTMTSFDKVLSRAQRTLSDGNETHAIGLIRRSLADAPVSNAEGAQAIAAYNTAKGLARQQFALADPKSQSYIPGYSAMLKGMGNADHDTFVSALENGTANVDPAQWFNQNVMKATPAAAQKMVNLLKQGGANDATEALGQGALSAIRDSVVKGTDVRSALSGDALNKVLGTRATLAQVLPDETLTGLQRLANTATRIQRAPQGSSVNWSNTAITSANLKEMAGAGIRTAVERNIPGGRFVMAGKDIISGGRALNKARTEALRNVNPSFSVPAKETQIPGTQGVPLSLLVGSQGSQP